MKLLQDMLAAQGGGAVRQIASRVGLRDADASAAIAKLLPALTDGLRRNAAAPGGAEGLLKALQSGSHRQYLEDPSRLADEESVRDGNGILGHLLGSKDESRRVAARAADETGIDAARLQQMLPLVAAMAMGALGRQSAGTGGLQDERGSEGLGGLLSGMLDSDGDGSVAGDLLGMAKKFLR